MVLQITIKDGLMFPTGVLSQAPYRCVVFCRVDESRIGDDIQETVFAHLYGPTWRMGNDDGSRYVVLSADSHILTPAEEQTAPWLEVTDTQNDHYWFYHAPDAGGLQNVEPSAF